MSDGPWELPKGWRWVKLGEVASVCRDTVQASDMSGSEAYLGLDCIAPGGNIVRWTTIGAEQVKSSKFRFNVDHILMGKLRPYLGKISLPRKNGLCSTDIIPIYAGPQVNKEYLTNWLRTEYMINEANKVASGANLPRIAPKSILSLIVPLPPLSEQRRISEVMKGIAAEIERNNAVVRSTEDSFSSFFDSLVSSEPIAASLGEVAEVQGGLQVSKKRDSLSNTAMYLRVANVYRGIIDTSEIKSFGITPNELKRTILARGDLLFVEGHANRSEVGRTAMFDISRGEYTHQNHLIRARVNTGKTSSLFLEYWFNSPKGREHFFKNARTTSGLNTISTSTVRSAPIPLPSEEIVARIVETKERADRQVQLLKERGRALVELKESTQAISYRGLF